MEFLSLTRPDEPPRIVARGGGEGLKKGAFLIPHPWAVAKAGRDFMPGFRTPGCGGGFQRCF
jgi:hypothetical protein